MNSLVKEIIKGLLPEEEKQITTAVYAGGFKPPTSGHFEVVKKALEENPEIDEFIIFIGAKERDGISQDESLLIWEIYNNYLPFKVKIEPTSVPPIKAVYDYAKNHPTREVLWIIGAREGNEEDFKDITSRTSSISKYPNLELRTIVTAGGVSGTAARNAAKVSFEKFEKFVPDVLSPEEKQEAYNLVSGKIQEVGDLSQTPYKWNIEPSSKSSPYAYYSFTTDNGTKYEVVFERQESKVDSVIDITYDMAFVAKGRDGGKFSSTALTGGNEPLKIMSTVVDITKKHIEKVGDADWISFSPTKGKQGEEGNDKNIRAKLYRLIIKKNFPNATVIGDDEDVLVNVSAYKPKKITEIGDLSQTPYSWKYLPDNSDKSTKVYRFEAKDGIQYEVNLYYVGSYADVDGRFEKGDWSLEFLAKAPGIGGYSSKALTGGGEPLKIMSTVVDITKDFIKDNGNVGRIVYTPTEGKSGERDAKDNVRGKLYKAIIQRSFPKAKISGSDNTAIIVDVSAYSAKELQEVGEANVSPYKWKETKKTSYSISYEFTTDSGIDYLVKFNDNDDDEDIDSLEQIRDWDISFFSKSQVGPDGDYSYSSSKVVNKGELFRVMSTIVDITKNVIKQFPNTKKLSFQPSPSKGDDTVDNQRGRLYKAFISKQLPQAKVDQEGSTVTINLPEKISLNENKSDPKKGTGKKPKGSGRRLYTDEDPSDTVGVKFSTRQDIVDTLNKTSFKNKSHARQSQIINLIHQRVRAAYNRAKDPEVKKRLKTALDYAEERKEASKAKTQRLKNQKENIDPKSQSQHKGKAAPYGSAYQKVKENIDNTFDRSQYYLEYYKRLSPSNFNLDLSDNKVIIEVPSPTNPINENASYTTTINIVEKIAQLTNHMIKKGMNVEPLPTVEFIDGDTENAKNFLGKTAYYDPERKHIVLYTEGRHPKDIVRSYAHEMIHHIQNLEGRLGNVSTTNTMEDDHLNNLEAEANLKGTMTFRNWTDSIQETKKKDPFGLNAYAQELARLREIKYLNPNFDVEWEEAIRYPEFKEKGKNTWLKIAKQGYTVNYSDIKNVLGNVNLNFKSLEEPKKQRFQSAFEKGTVEMPIAVKFSDSDYDLVAGNTRLSGLIKNDIDPKIWVVDLSNIQENYADGKVNEQEMSQDDFNTIGNVLRDSTKAKQIHSLLLQMFPQQKELLNYNYKNDSYAEFKRFIFHIDKYKLEGPVSINYTDLKLDPQIMKDRERKYQDYINGKVDKYFRDTNADPRKVDLSKMPPITVDETGQVMDGNHRAFLAIKQQKPLKGYKIVNANNTHPNATKILQIVGREIKENYADSKVNEAKQVGNLYHYTSADGLKGILQSNTLRASEEEYLGNELYYISFTRNKNFHKKGQAFNVRTDYRITLDGDKLSNKYKIKPFAYKPGWNYEYSWEFDWLEDEPESVARDFFDGTGDYDEQEERISFKDASGLIPNIKDYILKVDKVSDLKENYSLNKENLDKSKIKIYLDMDGVLADFNQRFRSLAGMEPNEFESKYGKTAFWDFIDEGDNKIRFWVGIPVMGGAKELVDLASKYNYSILTAPSAKKQSRLGKNLWIKKYIGDLFPSKPSVIFKKASEKHLVKPELTKNDILVDDKKSTIDNWNAAGGTGIFYKNISQVLNDLSKLGL